MRLTIKIFLFALILVQTTAKYESNEAPEIKDASTPLIPKENIETAEEFAKNCPKCRVKKRYVPMEPKNQFQATTPPPDDVKKVPLFKSEPRIINLGFLANSTSLAEIFSKIQMFINEIIRVFSMGKLQEILFNIKDFINHHKHPEGLPRYFTKDVKQAARKLLSAENAEKDEDKTPAATEGAKHGGEDEAADAKKNKTKDVGELLHKGKNKLNQLLRSGDIGDFDSFIPKFVKAKKCQGEDCENDSEETSKMFFKLTPTGLLKGNKLLKAVGHPSAMKLLEMTRNLRSVERALNKFEINLIRFSSIVKRQERHMQMEASVNSDPSKLSDDGRSKRFILKHKKKKLMSPEMERLSQDTKITTGRVLQLTEILKKYNLESKRIVGDLIVLMTSLKQPPGPKGFASIKRTYARLPKTIVHDFPSILVDVAHQILGKLETMKNKASAGARGIYKYYDDIHTMIEDFKISKTKYLYKLLTRGLE